MSRFPEVIHRDDLRINPYIKRKVSNSRESNYSPLMRKLIGEHSLIKRWVAVIPRIIEYLDIESSDSKQLLIDGIEFIQLHADKFHHAKEENEIFKYFDEDLEILRSIIDDHEKIRFYVRILIFATEENDKAAIAENLYIYRELLTDHIIREEEILYPWIDRNLTLTQIGELFSRFNEIDEVFQDAPARYKEFIEKLEEKFI
jgi:hemerythrin-like domain-containing protein